MSNFPQRENIRLKNYDYSQGGYYFVIICTKGRLGLFGEIVIGANSNDNSRQLLMQGNEVGEIICGCWNKINEIYENVSTDLFCLMPNHIHGIIVISYSHGQAHPSLAKIIQGFKSVTTRMCFKYNYKNIWQSNYYEHVIRNKEDYERIYEYIQSNPLKWKDDEYYI